MKMRDLDFKFLSERFNVAFQRGVLFGISYHPILSKLVDDFPNHSICSVVGE